MTGAALYTDDLRGRFLDLLHAWPVLAPHAHAGSWRSMRRRALGEPGVVRVLTAADVPGEGNTGATRHDEPLFPAEVMFHQQPVAWVLAETLDAAQRGAARVRVELRAAAGDPDHRGGDRRRQLPHRGRCGWRAATSSALDGERRCASRASCAIGGQEHFYLETQAAIAWVDETGGIARALVDAAPVRDAGGRRARARRAAASGHGRVPAHGRRVRRQGSAGQPVGGDRGARRLARRGGRCACG